MLVNAIANLIKLKVQSNCGILSDRDYQDLAKEIIERIKTEYRSLFLKAED